MGANVFLSYAKADSALAGLVADSLAHSGIEAELLHAGAQSFENFADQLRATLQRSDAVVVVLSDASLNNGWVMTELGAAMALNKRIVAIRPETSPPPISPYGLSHLETLNVAGRSADQIAAAIRDQLTA